MSKQLNLEGRGGIFWRVRLSKAHSGKPSPMKGKHQTEESNQKNREANSGEKNGNYGKRGEETSMYGVEPWNKGETKETNDIVKVSAEKCSKTLKTFFTTEKGQRWQDENNRGENNGMYGKGYIFAGEKSGMFGEHLTDEHKQSISEAHLGKPKTELHKQHMRDNQPDRSDEKNPNYKGGYNKARARSQEKRRSFGFIPLNDKFPGSDAHHLDTHFVLYILSELHNSVYHNVMTGQGMKEINDLAIRCVYGEHKESRW